MTMPHLVILLLVSNSKRFSEFTRIKTVPVVVALDILGALRILLVGDAFCAFLMSGGMACWES
jgi:hypothetical protein